MVNIGPWSQIIIVLHENNYRAGEGGGDAWCKREALIMVGSSSDNGDKINVIATHLS
jgi:hypothetical protein